MPSLQHCDLLQMTAHEYGSAWAEDKILCSLLSHAVAGACKVESVLRQQVRASLCAARLQSEASPRFLEALTEARAEASPVFAAS